MESFSMDYEFLFDIILYQINLHPLSYLFVTLLDGNNNRAYGIIFEKSEHHPFKWSVHLHHRFFNVVERLGGKKAFTVELQISQHYNNIIKLGFTTYTFNPTDILCLLFRSAAYLSCRAVVKLSHSSSHYVFRLTLASSQIRHCYNFYPSLIFLESLASMAESSFPSSSSSSPFPSVPPSIEGGQSSSAPENPTGTGFYPQPTPRFKWTPDLHRRFLEAIQVLGGLQYATPRAIAEVMDDKDLTISRVRSHLEIHRANCFDPEQLARETQAAVAQMAWAATVPYPYGYPSLYSAPAPALYSPLRPQLTSPPLHPPARLYIGPFGPIMPPTIPPSMRMMEYSAPTPKTIIFKMMGTPVSIDAEEIPELMMSGDINPGPSSSAARNEDQDDGPLDLTLSIRPPSRR
nr:putative Myb family transcription factor At1g14600 [Ipomoea batatas]